MAHIFFSILFSFMCGQRFTDTLSGTKVLTRKAYNEIIANRHYFGDFVPFGDFDLLFGAARRYGSTQISRFRHGWQLLRMVAFAFRKLKALFTSEHPIS